jgi:predicted dienelactone hydrolase
MLLDTAPWVTVTIDPRTQRGRNVTTGDMTRAEREQPVDPAAHDVRAHRLQQCRPMRTARAPQRSMRQRRVSIIAIGIVLAAACSTDDDATGNTAGTPASETPPATTDTVTTAPTTEPATTASGPAAPSTEPTVAPTAPPTSAAELALAEFGDYRVGVATITVDDPAGTRPLTVDVWFPLAEDAGELAPQEYTLLPGVFYRSPDAVAADSAAIATGPFPLVVYSHGSGGLRYLHSAYTEFLASHGYVVAAPDHTGNTALERLAGAPFDRDRIAFDRPNDVRRVIDALVDPAHPTAGAYASEVDGDRIAVTGHSFGGFTAVAVATGVTNPIGNVPPDERIDAIIPLAPALSTELLPDAELATLDVPMLIVVGADDTTTPVDPNVTRLWDTTTNEPAYRVELVAGEHQSFTDICAYQETVPTLPDVPQIVVDTIDEFALEGCAEGDMDDARVNELTGTYALAFLAEVFDGADPITAEPPDDVTFAAR